jgi:hypothetical protein
MQKVLCDEINKFLKDSDGGVHHYLHPEETHQYGDES